MKSTSPFQTIRPHLLFVLGLFVVAALYFTPSFQGKELPMSDIRQSYAATKELRDFKQKTGEFPLWTNALFSGMPAYMIAFDYPNTFVGTAVGYVTDLFPRPVSLLFFGMLSMYLLLAVMGMSGWLAAIGAVAFGLGTYNMISIEAGHVSKVFAVAYAPGILAGVILALRGRYWAGGALTALFVCLEFGANHVQITYYTFMVVGLYALIEGVALVRAGRARQLAMAAAVLLVAGLLGAGSYSKRLLVLNQYSKETIRGGSELTAKITAQNGQTAAPKDGLDEEYAFSYSYGLGETFTLLIPNFYGGTSGGGLDESSAFYQAMTSRGVDPAAAKQFVELGAPTYWGDQPFVGGPAYAGAVLLFLFVFGMLVSTRRIKWYVLASALLMLMIAWGRHFMLLNGLLFDYLPYFNKFRAVTMTFTLLQLFVGIGAALGLQELIDRKPAWKDVQRPLLISLGATAGLALLFALLGGTFFTFRTATDAQTLERVFGDASIANEMVTALARDRQSLMRADAFRSVLFILLAAGALALWVAGKLRGTLALPMLAALVLIDLFSVSKRYLNNADFIPKTQVNASFEPTPADEQIRQDPALSYRVFDQTVNFMNDNRTSFFHQSIGGYHAAKLRRYQELISYAFPQNTLNILNMLNAKYVIGQGAPTPGQAAPAGPVAQLNDGALGNAWFVRTVQQVPNADAEITAVQTLNPRSTAVVDARFAEQLRGLPAALDTTGSIRLTSYVPDHLTYESNAPGERLAVFSEIYYRGDTDWNAYIDGQKVPHLRANYVLRALRLPAGTHKIEFKFEPPVVPLGDTLDLIANLLLVAFIGMAVFLGYRNRTVAAAPADEPVAAAPTRPAKK